MNLTGKTIDCVSLPQELILECKSMLLPLEKEGLIYLAHGIKRQGVRTCFFSHDSWAEMYIAQQKYKTDPLTRMAETTTVPYFLWEQVTMNEQERAVTLARQKTCHIVQGITFSIYCCDFHEIIALGTSSYFINMMDLVTNQTFHACLIKLIQPIRHQHLAYRYQESFHDNIE